MTDPADHSSDPVPDPAARAAAREWVVRLASGGMTDGEMVRFKAWLAERPAHASAFDEARALWQRAAAVEEAFSSAETLPWHRRARPRLVAAAAALAAALVLGVFHDDIMVAVQADYATAEGSQRRIVLTDGSTVTLNTDSAIALRFRDVERRVELLRGEALFEVARDAARPFRVTAQGGATQAVGTAFVVRDAPARVLVSVTEGTVAVTSPETDGAPTTATLAASAGQRVAYRRGEPPQALGMIAPADAAPWRAGRIVMDGVPFADAIAELDRYRPGRILLLGEPARFRPVSGVFSIDKLDDALAGLAATHGLTATRLSPYLLVLR